MTWTKTKPAKVGYYWVKAESHKPRILLFEDVGPANGETLTNEDHPIQPQSGPLSTEGWLWFSGPIPEPVE